jgi:hypothetical protein
MDLVAQQWDGGVPVYEEQRVVQPWSVWVCGVLHEAWCEVLPRVDEPLACE